MRCLSAIFLALVAAEPETTRPVSKVINLLRDMQAQLQKEAEEDAALYDRLTCWCQGNGKDKETSIKTGDAKSKALVAKIEELDAKSKALYASFEKLKAEAEANRQGLLTAEGIRQQELAEFNKDHKDLLQAISGLDAAITVLSKHNSLVSTDVRTVINHALHNHEKMLGEVAVNARNVLGSFLQQPAGFQSKASESGAIFGILKQMKETFETNMGTALTEEKTAAANFAEMKAAKLEEIAAAKAQIAQQESEKAATDQEHAQSEENLEDTNAALAADRQFLADIKEKCATMDADWEHRTKTRSDEVAAVSEAIKILNEDEAHDGYAKTVNKAAPDFLQLSSHRSSMRASVHRILSDAAAKSQDPQLAALATSAKLDAFTKVKAAIDGMIKELNAQQADEVKHRDFCIAEFAENDKSKAENEQTKGNLDSQIADLTATIERLSAEIKAHQEEIASTKTEMKRASDNRAASNSKFQETVTDQRATQVVLQRAYDRMKQFYDPEVVVKGYNDPTPAPVPGQAFVDVPAGEAPPEMPKTFNEFNKNKGGNKVLVMLQDIIKESKTLENEAILDEKDEQAAYEGFVKDSNKQIGSLQKSVSDKSGARADAKNDKVQAEKDLDSTMTELESLAKYNGELHKACDFVQKNFDTRQAARAQEVEALRQAKAILSGSS